MQSYPGELNLILWYESSVGTYSSKQRLNDYIAYWPPWRWEDGYLRGSCEQNSSQGSARGVL